MTFWECHGSLFTWVISWDFHGNIIKTLINDLIVRSQGWYWGCLRNPDPKDGWNPNKIMGCLPPMNWSRISSLQWTERRFVTSWRDWRRDWEYPCDLSIQWLSNHLEVDRSQNVIIKSFFWRWKYFLSYTKHQKCAKKSIEWDLVIIGNHQTWWFNVDIMGLQPTIWGHHGNIMGTVLK